ncbi:hypothetical protein [Marinilabilia salmonicolor]|nr:hypothetical protein [Marinilabilia salmonicolor]
MNPIPGLFTIAANSTLIIYGSGSRRSRFSEPFINREITGLKKTINHEQ